MATYNYDGIKQAEPIVREYLRGTLDKAVTASAAMVLCDAAQLGVAYTELQNHDRHTACSRALHKLAAIRDGMLVALPVEGKVVYALRNDHLIKQLLDQTGRYEDNGATPAEGSAAEQDTEEDTGPAWKRLQVRATEGDTTDWDAKAWAEYLGVSVATARKAMKKVAA